MQQNVTWVVVYRVGQECPYIGVCRVPEGVTLEMCCSTDDSKEGDERLTLRAATTVFIGVMTCLCGDVSVVMESVLPLLGEAKSLDLI